MPATQPGTVTITGVVIDSLTRLPLRDATIVVQEPGSNTALKTTLTNPKGFFELTALPSKTLQLTLSYAGYKATILHLRPSSHTSLGQVPLATNAPLLKEVQVVALKPLIEQDIGKLTYNVDADPESRLASAFEILQKVPLLSVDADDNLVINGSSNYRILVNGKSSSLFALNQSGMLRNMSASSIKTIEVITVPSSKYEAAGVGGILNIITYKKTISGYNGGLNLRAGSPKTVAASGSLSVNTGKITFAGNGNYTANNIPASNNVFLRNDKLLHTKLEQWGAGDAISRAQNCGGEISYAINDLNTLTLGYSANANRGSSQFAERSLLSNVLQQPIESYRRFNTESNNGRGADFGIDYQRGFKRNDAQELTLSYKWSHTAGSTASDFILQPLVRYPEQLSTTTNDDGFDEYTIRADYIHPVKKHTLEIGASTIHRQSSSSYFYKDKDTISGLLITDTTQSNSFSYRETIQAGYASLNLRLGKWGIRAGSRVEHAGVDAHFISSRTIAQRNYLNIIPTLTLSRTLKGFSTLTLSYTQRIQRPALDYLDPYTDRSDLWNISYGNPELQPALAHVLNLASNLLIKKTAITISLYHQFTNNAIQQFTTLGRDTITRTTYGNIGRTRNYNLLLGCNTTLFKNLSLNLNSSAYYVFYTSTIKGGLQTNKGLTYNLSGTATLRLKSWRASGSISYNAPNIIVQGKTAGYVSNSFTLSRFLFKNNKATIGLNISSPFQEYRRSSTEINDPAFYQLRQSNTVLRRYSLSFNYRLQKVAK